ncbi:hypothetical protein M1432_02655 [Patescibacteria group bacterium]|nr:hypothetical protein [Patescibacteria group bacterium]
MKPYIKIIVIAAIIVVAGLLVYFAWNWFSGSPSAPSASTSSAPYFPLAGLTSTSTGATSTAAVATSGISVGTLTKVSDRPASFFWTDPATQEVFYLDQNGLVWQAEPGQKNPQITQQGVAAVNFIKASPDYNSVLAAFGDPQNPSWGIYDAIDQVWRPLPANILQATWGSNSQTLIATVQNGSNINLVSLDLTKTPPQPKIIINDFRFLDTKFDIVPPNTLLIEEKGAANYASRVWSLNLKTLAINPIIGPANGLMVKLVNNGSTLVAYSASNGFQILSSQTMQNLAPIPFTTLPSKCSDDSGPTIYCFVPTDQDFKSASLPDDYIEHKLYTTDALYAIDTQNGSTVPLPVPANAVGAIDGKDPAVAGGNLYFINRLDGYLYALQVPANTGGPGNAVNGEYSD